MTPRRSQDNSTVSCCSHLTTVTLYIKNLSLTTPQLGWFTLKTQMIASTLAPGANWTVISSSTGNGGVYAQSGDVITSVSSLGNLSWFVLRGHAFIDSGVTCYRYLCFQFNAAGDVRITYSPRLGFVAGSPSTTQVPSATDGQLVYGGGTDASPTFAALLPTGGTWMQALISEVDDFFEVFTYNVGGSALTSLFYLEPIPPVYTISGNLIDGDPVVIYARAGVDCSLRSTIGQEAKAAFGTLGYGLPLQTLWARLAAGWRAVADSSDVAQQQIPAGLVTQPSPYISVPTYRAETMLYGRRTALSGTTIPGDVGNVNTVGAKGEGTYLRWSGTLFATPTLVDAVDLGCGCGAGTVIGAGHLFLPWTDTALSM